MSCGVFRGRPGRLRRFSVAWSRTRCNRARACSISSSISLNCLAAAGSSCWRPAGRSPVLPSAFTSAQRARQSFPARSTSWYQAEAFAQSRWGLLYDTKPQCWTWVRESASSLRTLSEEPRPPSRWPVHQEPFSAKSPSSSSLASRCVKGDAWSTGGLLSALVLGRNLPMSSLAERVG